MADSFISALLASLLLQAGVVGFLAERWLIGYGLVSLGAAILILRLEAAGLLSRERMQGLLVGLVIATLSTVYLRSLRGGFAGEDAPQNTAHLGSGKYRGVILWTEPKSPAVLVAPRPPAGRGLNQSKQPLSIPFDGVYWFFKFPDRQPPKDSYAAYGSPSETTFRSSDSIPLEMEARQSFVNLLDMSCCSRVDIEITNADRYPGTVSIELILTNSLLAGRPFQSLGRLPVTSIPQRITESQLRPTHEVLGFPIPANSRIRQFDSATVRFIRNGKRGIRSAQIGVERFTLVPRGL